MSKIYINADGINNTSNVPLPDEKEVEKCAKILKYVKQKSEYTSVSSYELKHIIEKEIGYVSNGAFIEALSETNLDFIPAGRTNCAFVKFTNNDLRLAILDWTIDQEQHLKNSDKLLKIKKYFHLCSSEKTRDTISKISDTLKNSLNDNEINEEIIYKILKKENFIFFENKKTNFTNNKEFLDSMKVNFSIQKLKRYIAARI